MQKELRRDLGLPQAMLTVIGIVIGSGIFALPAAVFASARAPGLGLLSWVLGGVISLAAGLTIAELAAAMPRAGGSYDYLRAAYGDGMAFLQGWASFLAYNSALMAALAMVFSTYLTGLVPLSPAEQTAVALGMIGLLTVVNAMGVRFGGWIQVISTLGKLVPIFLIIVMGLARLDPARLGPLLPTDGGVSTALAGALLSVLWAYDGWIMVGPLAEEIRDPQRNLPLALIGGLAIVTAVYTLFNVALVGVLPMATITGSENPVMPLAQLLFGSGGAKLITLGMLVSMFGTLNAVTMTAPRHYFAMARDGLFPAAKTIATLHPKHRTPVAALLVSAGWAAVLVISGKFGELLNLVVFVAWLFYVFTMAAVLILRRTRPEMERPYKVWGYPVVPLVGIGAALWILYSSFVTAPKISVLGLGLTLTGLPVYAWLRRQSSTARVESDAPVQKTA